MEQHPIPQNISSYQFRLVGDMTLKQFFQLAGGALISIIIYSLPLHPIIKWPFIIFFSLFGAALAFLPFQERPLEQWIIAFFRSVYSPTVFKWREVKGIQYFQPQTGSLPKPAPAPTAKTQSLNLPFVNTLEETEGKFLSKLADLFSSAPVPVPAVATQPASPFAVSSTPQGPEILAGGYVSPVAGLPMSSMSPVQNVPQKESVAIPQTPLVTSSVAPRIVVEEEMVPTPILPTNVQTEAVAQILTGEGISASQTAQFSTDAAPPSPPTIPNTISGQVINPEGKFIEGAILEVKDVQGRPVRALRSNKVGHFLTVTPLLNGKYELSTDKEGFYFEPVVIDAQGGFIPPIAIRAKARSVATQVV